MPKYDNCFYRVDEVEVGSKRGSAISASGSALILVTVFCGFSHLETSCVFLVRQESGLLNRSTSTLGLSVLESRRVVWLNSGTL